MKNLKIKTILACVLLIGVVIASGAILVSQGTTRYIAQEQKKMYSALGELFTPLEDLEMESNYSNTWINDNITHTTLFMRALLSELMDGDQYTGPRTFEDGMVVEIRNGKLILPEDKSFTAPVLADNVADTLQQDTEEEVLFFTAEFAQDPGKDAAEDSSILQVCSTPLGNNYYYLNWTSEEEINEYYHMHDRVADMLSEVETALGGSLLVLMEREYYTAAEDHYFIEYPSASLPELENDNAESCQALSQALENKDTIITINGERYGLCTRQSDTRILAFLFPYQPIFANVLIRVVVVLGLLCLAGITLIVYLYYVQKESDGRIRNPRKLLGRILAAGLAGALLVAGASAFVQAVESLQDATVSSQRTMEQLLDLTTAHESTVAQETSKEEELWYVYDAELMAEIFSDYPQLVTADKLQELCDILEIDYIMLFDSRGKETLCNKEYSNFTLGTGQGENGAVFRHLLQGVDAIVQPASYDETTDITRQYIGVSIPNDSYTDPQGALILALLPEQTSRTSQNHSLSLQFRFISSNGDTYFGVNASDGEIRYSSNEEYVGTSIFRFGLSEKSLKGGYMGFAQINQDGYYVVTTERGNHIYYCFLPSANLFFDVVPFALISLLCYAVLYVLLSLVMLWGLRKNSIPQAEDPEDALDNRQARVVKRWGDAKVPWAKRKAKGKAAAVFKIVLLIFILLICIYELTGVGSVLRAGSSLFRFIFLGNWMRGINLFSISAILMLVIALYIITTLVKWIFRVFPPLFGSRGETIGKLLSSFSNYIAILVGIYFSLEYLGLQPSTILAGLGIVGLAITMGAKDMITDIFAGISIVFEGAFQVGDIIKIGNSQGRVESIGIRMTKITDTGGNVRILNNKEIKDVINLTRLNSVSAVTMKIPREADFPRIRAILERELPLIGQRNPDILSTPSYAGITDKDEKTTDFIISIYTACAEEKKFAVTSYIYEEVVELLKKEECL